ncbi:TPA: DUF4097 domain-containing protein [Clostridioides difficile]|uniref:DUF4097 family beta strand repeat-containing protein n=1 Tax=Clostridioides difficile TaxID=1496 RepID=UPI00374FA80D
MNKKLIKAKIFTWSIVAISLSIVFVSLLIGTIISHSFNFPFNILNPKYNYDNYIVAKNESFSDKINDINVDWISGEVRIKRSDSNKIKLIQKIPSNFSKKKLAKIMVDGDSLSIYDNSADIYSTYIRSNTVEANTVSGAIGLSGNINKINLDTTSGHIDVAKLNSKNATLKSTSGEIQLSGKIDVLNLETTNGDINLKDIYNKNLTCSSVSGKMNLSGVFSDIKAESTSSNIKITSSKMLSSLYCETTSANVDLSIPDNPGFTLNFDKVSGVLDSDFELNRHSDLYTYKNGITDLYLSTTNGNLTIIKNNH